MVLIPSLFVAFLLAQSAVGQYRQAHTYTARQLTITNLLIAEKTYKFADLIATAPMIKEKLMTIHWLPIFFEDNVRFSQFFMLLGNFTANEGSDACQYLDGATLASLHTEQRIKFIHDQLHVGNFWVGLSRFDTCPAFMWSNGMQATTAPRWVQNEPKLPTSGANCGRTVNPPDLFCNRTTSICMSNTIAGWASESCDGGKYPVLCETAYPRQMFAVIPGPFTAQQARHVCENPGATMPGAEMRMKNPGLAQPKSLSLFNNLIRTVTSHPRPVQWPCWVGVQRQAHHNQWVYRWDDGTYATRFSHFPIAGPTDNNADACMAISATADPQTMGGSEGFFSYQNCNTQLSCAICQAQQPV